MEWPFRISKIAAAILRTAPDYNVKQALEGYPVGYRYYGNQPIQYLNYKQSGSLGKSKLAMKKIFDLAESTEQTPVPSAKPEARRSEKSVQSFANVSESENACRMCGKKLTLMQRISRQAFCSDAHKEEFQQQSNQFALSVLMGAKESREQAPAQETPPSAQADQADHDSNIAAQVSNAEPAIAVKPREPIDPPECGYSGCNIVATQLENAIAQPEPEDIELVASTPVVIPAGPAANLGERLDVEPVPPQAPPPPVPETPAPRKAGQTEQPRVALPASIANLLAVTQAQTNSLFTGKVRTSTFSLTWKPLARTFTSHGPVLLPEFNGETLGGLDGALPLSLTSSFAENGWPHCGRNIEISMETVSSQPEPLREPAAISFSSGW